MSTYSIVGVGLAVLICFVGPILGKCLAKTVDKDLERLKSEQK